MGAVPALAPTSGRVGRGIPADRRRCFTALLKRSDSRRQEVCRESPVPQAEHIQYQNGSFACAWQSCWQTRHARCWLHPFSCELVDSRVRPRPLSEGRKRSGNMGWPTTHCLKFPTAEYSVWSSVSQFLCTCTANASSPEKTEMMPAQAADTPCSREWHRAQPWLQLRDSVAKTVMS